jgi:hypothetical protein
METLKLYTTIEQSRKLTEILPLESADLYYNLGESNIPDFIRGSHSDFRCYTMCWSLAALLKVLHCNKKDIVSLSYGGYWDGEYLLKWAIDYELENGDYYKTVGDSPVDACVEMIIKLKGLDLL